MRVRNTTLAIFAACAWTAPAYADTFGGQLHGVRSRGALDGISIDATGDRDDRLPASLELEGEGELAGADFRFDFLFDDLRLGAGLMVFGVRDLRLASDRSWTIGNGFGGSLEVFVGYELMRGPVYLYADVRTMAQGFEAPVTWRDEVSSREVSADYGGWSVGLGPRLGALVPVGLSLTVDFAVYQRVLGGFEGTTGFVGLGYWENDRSDPFTDKLDRSFGGDF